MTKFCFRYDSDVDDIDAAMPVVIVPNWNGIRYLPECLRSLESQTVRVRTIVADNGSTDGSQDLIRSTFPEVRLIQLDRNYGFTGGVNAGLRLAMSDGAEYAILLNNDAIAAPNFAEELLSAAISDPQAGIVTAKFLDISGQTLDSTGELYSWWGIPFPRGRGSHNLDEYDDDREVFGATGGATLYRTRMLRKIGLFDQEFFAYYEDVDLSFRAQLAGWKVRYEPGAYAYHHIGATSTKLGTFSRYHTTKNVYYLYAKNMPTRLFWKYLPRFVYALVVIIGSGVKRREFAPLVRAHARLALTVGHVLRERRRIQRARAVPVGYIDSILYRQIPPTQREMRRLYDGLSLKRRRCDGRAS